VVVFEPAAVAEGDRRQRQLRPLLVGHGNGRLFLDELFHVAEAVEDETDDADQTSMVLNFFYSFLSEGQSSLVFVLGLLNSTRAQLVPPYAAPQGSHF